MGLRSNGSICFSCLPEYTFFKVGYFRFSGDKMTDLDVLIRNGFLKCYARAPRLMVIRKFCRFTPRTPAQLQIEDVQKYITCIVGSNGNMEYLKPGLWASDELANGKYLEYPAVLHYQARHDLSFQRIVDNLLQKLELQDDYLEQFRGSGWSKRYRFVSSNETAFIYSYSNCSTVAVQIIFVSKEVLDLFESIIKQFIDSPELQEKLLQEVKQEQLDKRREIYVHNINATLIETAFELPCYTIIEVKRHFLDKALLLEAKDMMQASMAIDKIRKTLESTNGREYGGFIGFDFRARNFIEISFDAFDALKIFAQPFLRKRFQK